MSASPAAQGELETGAAAILMEAATTLVNPALQEWKDQGGKVVGCMYHFVPEGLITAAGLLPYRMRAIGSTGTELSESRFPVDSTAASAVRAIADVPRGRDDGGAPA